MFFLDQDLIYSASDLVTAAGCEFASLSKLDERLGRSAKADFGPDEMLERTAVLGDAHEHKVLGELREKFGDYDPVHRPRGQDARRRGPRGPGLPGSRPTRKPTRRCSTVPTWSSRQPSSTGNSSVSPTSSSAKPTAPTRCGTPSSPATPASPPCCSWPPTATSSSAHGIPVAAQTTLVLGDKTALGAPDARAAAGVQGPPGTLQGPHRRPPGRQPTRSPGARTASAPAGAATTAPSRSPSTATCCWSRA